MGSRLGRRVVHFANLPIKLLMPSSLNNIREIALKTIPSASKIEIKRVLESVYGFEVEKVQTLNMEGKKRKKGGLLIAKPDYKKAYVTLRNPLSISPNLYPIRLIEDTKKEMNKQQTKPSIVEEGEVKSHWLDNRDSIAFKAGKTSSKQEGGRWGNRKARELEKSSREQGLGFQGNHSGDGMAKFPWSSMKTSR